MGAEEPSEPLPPASAEELLRRYAAGERSFSNAQLEEAGLRKAELAHADLRDASLRSAVLCRANLTGADLRGAKLWSANLTGATFEQARLSPDTVLQRADLTGVDLSNVHGEPLLDLTVIRDTRFPATSGRWQRLLHRVTGAYSVRGALARALKRGKDRPALAGRPEPPVTPRWVLLRRTYTGTRFAWLFLLTALFLLPLGLRTAFWVGVNHSQATASPALAEAADALAALETRLAESLPRQADSAVGRQTERLRGLLTPCLAAHCDTVSVMRSLLRVGDRPTGVAALLGRYGPSALLGALLLFNLARGWLTYRVGGLRDVELESGVSPAVGEYRALWRAHVAVRMLQIVAIAAFADNAIGLLDLEVAVPAGWFR